MSAIRPDLTREEVAAVVCDGLDRIGIPVVLSGGAAVSIYTDNEYESFDLEVEAWSGRERSLGKFERFLAQLRG